MKKEEKNKEVWSQVSKKVGKKVKTVIKIRPVSAWILVEKHGVWEDLTKCAKESGMSIGDYLIDILETNAKINAVVFPIADSFGRKRLPFKDEIVEVLLQSVEGLDSIKLIKEADALHKNILTTLKGRINERK